MDAISMSEHANSIVGVLTAIKLACHMCFQNFRKATAMSKATPERTRR